MSSATGNPARELADRLNAGQVKTRLAGANFMALCPAHHDSDPSLSIRWNGSKLLFRCHTGCSFREIARSLRELGYDPEDGSPLGVKPASKRAVPIAEEIVEDSVYALWDGWFDAATREAHDVVPDAVRRHVYRDYDGTPLMRVETTLTPVAGKKAKKRFHPRVPHVMTMDGPLGAKGATVIKEVASPVPRPPYRAECLGTEGPVIYVEGEKCADAFSRYIKGAVPVVAVYGNNPVGTDFSRMKGRPLVIYKDADASGDGHAFKVAQMHGGPTGVATAPWIGEGPTPEGWDIADAIEGLTWARPMRYREMLEGLRDNAIAHEQRAAALAACAADPALAVLSVDAALYKVISPSAPESVAVANVDILDAGEDGGAKVMTALPKSTRIIVLHGESRSQRIIAGKLAKRRQTALTVMGEREGLDSWEALVAAIRSDAAAEIAGANAIKVLIKALRAANPTMRDD